MFKKVIPGKYLLTPEVADTVYHEARGMVNTFANGSDIDTSILDQSVKELMSVKVASLADANIKRELMDQGFIIVNVGTELRLDVTVGIHDDRIVYGVYEP